MYKFCCRWGTAVDKEEDLVRYFFQRGFPYSVFLLLMKKYHAVEIFTITVHFLAR